MPPCLGCPWPAPRSSPPSAHYCTCKITDFFFCGFYEKIKSSKDTCRKYCLRKSVIAQMCKISIACFLAECNILVFVGVLTTGIQNRCILHVRYVPHLSDEVRCSEASRFSITKIWYAYACSSVEMLKRYMIRKLLGSPALKLCVSVLYLPCNHFNWSC